MKVLVNDIYANLKGIPRDKMENVAIWGWSPEGADLLTLAINERIHIKYFVDYNHMVYKNETIFDKRVIGREELAACEDIFVIMGRKSFEEEQVWIENNLLGRYLVVDIGKPAAELCNSNGGIYIYGAGIAGGRTLEILKEHGIEIEGFIDSNEEKVGTTWFGCPIYSRNVLQEEDRIIISALYWAEIYDSLKNELDPEHIYVDYRNSRVSNRMMRYKKNSIFIKYQNYPVIMLDNLKDDYITLLADFAGKEICIYGKNEIAEQVIEILGCLGLAVSLVTDDIADLACRDLENQMILLTKVNDKASSANKCVVWDSGADFENWDILYFSQWRSVTSISYAEKKCYRDRLVSFVPEYTGHQYMGFYTHGSPSESKKRIVVLGGSTSDAGLFGNAIASWPEYLARKRDDVVIYNGGVGGFISAEECLKMIRDVVHIKPDLVISYSGINDCYRTQAKSPFKNEPVENMDVFYGLESGMTKSEHWLLMERYMHAVALEMGADFIAILQTSVHQREDADRSAHEQLASAMWEDTYSIFVKNVQEVMNKYDDWLYDLSKPFEEIKYEVFRDPYHLNDKGNCIIADKISDIIDDYYKYTK